eukprot:2793198-Alexandrium_andersonii.AAC.1
MWDATSWARTPGPAGTWQPVDVTDGIFQGELAASEALAATITSRVRKAPEAARVERVQG